MKRGLALFLAALLAALTLTACGGDGSSAPAASESQTDSRSEVHTSELQSHYWISYAVFWLKK